MTEQSVHSYIWVVGASSGIGEALVSALDDVETTLFVSARTIESSSDTFSNALATVIPINTDISDELSVKRATQKIKQYTRYLDSVIINAGTCEYIDTYPVDVNLVKRVMDTNFYGAINIVNASLPLLRQAKSVTQSSPQLVLVSSSVTYQSLPRAGAYGASKAGIRYFLECLKLDLQYEGIDVRIVSPGFVKTPLTDKNDFPMPFRISAEEAAVRIVSGLKGRDFDIHFPKRFTWILKAIARLPDSLRFKLVGKSSRHEQSDVAKEH